MQNGATGFENHYPHELSGISGPMIEVNVPGAAWKLTPSAGTSDTPPADAVNCVPLLFRVKLHFGQKNASAAPYPMGALNQRFR